MTFFITVLRMLAACLITNSHYTGVYPLDIIASGGLIGDVIFFAVSGYCLYNVKGSFVPWYFKRLRRCYLPVLIITALYMLLGFYSLSEHNALWWYAYPTYYHFVASIVVLYVPYYVVMKVPFLRRNLNWIMLILAVWTVAIYAVFYDKSYYHIDTVREPFVRFLFFGSMLLGAHFKQHDELYRNRLTWWKPVCALVMTAVYFVSKILFTRYPSLAPLQILNQVAIFALLYFILATFSALDSRLEKMPKWIKRAVSFVAAMTLEIYVVQYVLISLLRNVAPFPLNWLVLTAAILASAAVLHYLCKGISFLTAKAASAIFKKRVKE